MFSWISSRKIGDALQKTGQNTVQFETRSIFDSEQKTGAARAAWMERFG